MALYVDASVSLSFPQVLPDMAFRALFLDCILLLTFLACWLKVSNGSNVTPRIFGCLVVGTIVSSMIMSRVLLTSFVHNVNNVAEDFPGESSR